MKCALLIEDHNAFRQALSSLLSREPDIEAVAEASSIEDGRAAVLGELGDVDVVVTEWSLSDGSATEFLRALGEAEADVSVLVLTRQRDRRSHEEALGMGATRILTKDASVERIVASIKELGDV